MSEKPLQIFVPDWKNPKNYPSVEGTPMEQWAWEFVRRSRQYVADLKMATTMLGYLKEKGRELDSIPEFIPADLSEKRSLRYWKCFPLAKPYKKTLGKYHEDLNKRPDFGIRRDLYVLRRWRITSLVNPDETYSKEIVSFRLGDHHPTSLKMLTSGKPAIVRMELLPYQVPVVIDLMDSFSDQVEQLRQSLKKFHNEPSISTKLLIQGKEFSVPKPYHLWVLLRLADATRAHQVEIGLDRKRIKVAEEFTGAKFKYQQSADHIRREIAKPNYQETEIYDKLEKSLNQPHLRKCRNVDLVAMICRRGHLTLLQK